MNNEFTPDHVSTDHKVLPGDIQQSVSKCKFSVFITK